MGAIVRLLGRLANRLAAWIDCDPSWAGMWDVDEPLGWCIDGDWSGLTAYDVAVMDAGADEAYIERIRRYYLGEDDQ